ncbi:MAG: PAS domain S-box protein [Desulfobacterales bacterium]
MKLRLILLVLSLLAFLSASTGGYLYYTSIKESALKEAERQAVARVQTIKKNLSSYLSENRKPVRALAGMRELKRVLLQPTNLNAMVNANAVLDHFNKTLDTEVCYLMTREGDTIASSNRNAPDSFVGKNFDFRPYFQQAIQGKPATYLALGTTSGRRGSYYSHPVPGEAPGTFAGVVVIKAAIEQVEKELVAAPDEIVLVTDPQGIVFISNRKNWLYHSLRELTPDQKSRIEDSIQFGHGPWVWTGLTIKGEKYAVDSSGNEYLMHRLALDNYSGWKIIHLRSLKAISKTVSDPLFRIAGPLILTLCVLIGLSVFFLYRKASVEIRMRQTAEKALRESEVRYRRLYHHTPAMLHSIDINGRIVSVSDYWSEVMGYRREDVIGRRLTAFFSEESRRFAEEKVFPEFFKTGFIKDVPYQFVKKDGRTIDVLLSAIADRDEQGIIMRTLAVSIDVTERKRAEEALKLAKEELSRYSKDLERQVQSRTREIHSNITALKKAQDQLRRLSAGIMAGQEKERSAIARELHDELGQVLTALRMDSVWLQERLKGSDAKASQRALTMCQLIDKNIEDVRGMAFRLRPGVLDDLGLVDALDWYTTDFERRTEITCVFEYDNVPPLSETVATAAYRITQEAITNVTRHAFASRVQVALKARNSTLTLAVVDDGRGFDPLELSDSEGLGVAGMRERASLVGGTLEVHSRPGEGTRVFFKVPVDGKVDA